MFVCTGPHTPSLNAVCALHSASSSQQMWCKVLRLAERHSLMVVSTAVGIHGYFVQHFNRSAC